MCITENYILNYLNGIKADNMPIWFMRQAGRYLPEYLECRKKSKNFISFCLNPILASEVTIQPIKRFDLDAAIIFADILLIPYAFGQEINFIKNKGPVLEKMNNLEFNISKIKNVFETISIVREKLEKRKTLIGFAGSPWTVACYMIDGKGGDFSKSKYWAQNKKDELKHLISILTIATIEYLKEQIKHGVDIIQLFESNAGLLHEKDFEDFILKPTKNICDEIKKEFKNIPIIGFPRGAKLNDYKQYAKETNIDIISLDQFLSLKDGLEIKKNIKYTQGNLDPKLLLVGGDKMKQEAKKIYETIGENHIFNLGHGIIKETNPDNVKELVNFVRGLG